jgi:hypothetical protein
MEILKLHVLLAKTEHLISGFKNMVQDYATFFKGSQGAFRGEKRTYAPKDGVVDDPTKRGNVLVQTTVDEKFDWFVDHAEEYINAALSMECTNASGVANAELVVDAESWGTYSSLELLRLKSILENGELGKMLATIPVRSDSEQWDPTIAEMYKGRKGIFETELQESMTKTTVKTNYILDDPNVSKLKEGIQYNPHIGVQNEVVELGDYTQQKFSGEYSQRQRAEILSRRAKLIAAIIVALKKCNECEVVESNLTAHGIFTYLLDRDNP